MVMNVEGGNNIVVQMGMQMLLPYIHIEAKAVEKMELYKWMEQAKRDARLGEYPVVFHKKNNADILVTMTFDDFMEIYKEFEASMTLEE